MSFEGKSFDDMSPLAIKQYGRDYNDYLIVDVDRNEDINCAIEEKLLETSTASNDTTINIDQASASNIALGLERINNWMNLENNVRLKDNCNG